MVNEALSLQIKEASRAGNAFKKWPTGLTNACGDKLQTSVALLCTWLMLILNIFNQNMNFGLGIYAFQFFFMLDFRCFLEMFL